MHHEADDSHLRCAPVVELDGHLLFLPFVAEIVPCELVAVLDTVAEVSGELPGPGDVAHYSQLKETGEENHLKDASHGDGILADDGSHAVGVGVERVSGEVDISRQVDSGAGGDLPEEGKHGDASVLELNKAEAVELLLAGAIKHVQGIPKAEGGLRTNLVRVVGGGLERGGGHVSLGGGEGGGGAGEGGEEDGLHHVRFLLVEVTQRRRTVPNRAAPACPLL